MITRTFTQETSVISSSISLRAEVLLLSIITIFGVIGLCYSIGLYQISDDISADFQDVDRVELVHDRQAKT